MRASIFRNGLSRQGLTHSYISRKASLMYPFFFPNLFLNAAGCMQQGSPVSLEHRLVKLTVALTMQMLRRRALDATFLRLYFAAAHSIVPHFLWRVGLNSKHMVRF